MTILDGESDCDTESFLNQEQSLDIFHIFPICGVRTQSPVAFAISSPTFFGERPRGPILGASAEEAPTSPPVALRWLQESISFHSPPNYNSMCHRVVEGSRGRVVEESVELT